MRLELVAPGVRLTESLRETVSRYVSGALENFSRHVGRVLVTLRDVNGPRRGADDKHCQIEVKLAHAGVLVANADGPLYEPAVHRAAAKMRRQLESVAKR